MRVAVLLVAQPACNRLVSGANPHAGITAFDRLFKADVLIRSTPVPLLPTTYAQAPQASAVGSITVFSPFLTRFNFNDVRGAFGNYLPTRTPSLVQLRATFLLHEVAHLTNAQSHPDGDPNAAFNRAVLQECLGILTFPPSAPPTGPDRR